MIYYTCHYQHQTRKKKKKKEKDFCSLPSNSGEYFLVVIRFRSSPFFLPIRIRRFAM